MLKALLQVSGIEQQLLAFRARIEATAERLIAKGKSFALKLAIGAALGVGAIALVFMAIVWGLLSLYLWLVPHFGNVGAAAAVGGCLLLVGIILAVAATVIVRQKPSVSLRAVASLDEPGIHEPKVLQEDERVLSEPKPVPAATPREAEAVVTIAQRFARVPETGIEPIDELLRDFTPHAKEAGKRSVRACRLSH